MKIVQIAAAGWYSYALDENGKAWIWGGSEQFCFCSRIVCILCFRDIVLVTLRFTSFPSGITSPMIPYDLEPHTFYKIAASTDGILLAAGQKPDPINVDPKKLMLREEVLFLAFIDLPSPIFRPLHLLPSRH